MTESELSIKDRAIFAIKRTEQIKDIRSICWLDNSDTARARSFIKQYGVIGRVHSWKTEPSLEMQGVLNVDFLDHVICFKCKSGNIITSQPYTDGVLKIGKGGMTEQAQKWAEERDMTVEERPDLSWHCPGNTTLFIFKDKRARQ